MNIDSTSSGPAVAYLTALRAALSALTGAKYTSVRLSVAGDGQIEWSIYTGPTGKFATGSDLAAVICEQTQHSVPARKA